METLWDTQERLVAEVELARAAFLGADDQGRESARQRLEAALRSLSASIFGLNHTAA